MYGALLEKYFAIYILTWNSILEKKTLITT